MIFFPLRNTTLGSLDKTIALVVIYSSAIPGRYCIIIYGWPDLQGKQFGTTPPFHLDFPLFFSNFNKVLWTMRPRPSRGRQVETSKPEPSTRPTLAGLGMVTYRPRTQDISSTNTLRIIPGLGMSSGK